MYYFDEIINRHRSNSKKLDSNAHGRMLQVYEAGYFPCGVRDDGKIMALHGSMPFCVELDNLKDTDAPIHQPAAMLVAAD